MAGAALKRRERQKRPASPPLSYLQIFLATPADRIRLIKNGVPAIQAKRLTTDLRFEQAVLFEALNLKTATVNRKAARDETLSPEDGERVIGVAKLMGQLEAMVEESGDPAGFDAPAWLSQWLREPSSAFGGAKPIDMLDTMEGQSLVAQALAQVQSGAYA